MNIFKLIRHQVNPQRQSFYNLFFNIEFLTNQYQQNKKTLFRGNKNISLRLNSKKKLRKIFKLKILRLLSNSIIKLLKLEEKIDIVVFGSCVCGTNYAEGFSDIDLCFIILKEEILRLRLIFFMYLINRLVYFLNPLQHHSAFVTFRNRDWLVDGNGLAIEALEDCCLLTSNNDQFIQYRYDSFFLIDDKEKHLNNLKQRILSKINNKNINDIFSIQKFIAEILLLPCLILQTKGLNISKKNSFDEKYLSDFKVSFKEIENIRKTFFKAYKYDWLIIGWFNLINPKFSKWFYKLEHRWFYGIRSNTLKTNRLLKGLKNQLEF